MFTNSKTDINALFSFNEAVRENLFLSHEIYFRGVIVDENLTQKPHTAQIKKGVKNISVLRKVKYVLDYKSIRIFYHLLIFLFLSYCVEVRENTYVSSLHSLFLLQKKTI